MASSEQLRDIFKRCDEDGDGTMNLSELAVLLQKIGMDDQEVEVLFETIDANQNGKVSYDELLNYLFPSENAARLLEQTRGGSLIIIGGGRTPLAACERFIEYAGGSAAKLVVIPTGKASADKAGGDSSYVDSWNSFSPASVTVVHTRDREMANSEEFVAPLLEATGVWIPGGNQWRLSDAYYSTAVETAIYRVLERGGVVMGSSAGAAIQSRIMIAGSQAKAIRKGRDPDKYWPPPGFDLFRWTVVDQHFGARNRKARLAAKLQEHSGKAEDGMDLVGYGIDEHTALVIPAGAAAREIIGEGTVTVLAFDEDSGAIKERVLRPEDGVIDASSMLEELEVGQVDADEDEEPDDWEARIVGDVLVGGHWNSPPWTGDADSYLISLIDLGYELGGPNGACYFQLLDGTAYVYGETQSDGGPGPDAGQTENESTWLIVGTERD